MHRLVLFTLIALNSSASLAVELREALKSSYNNNEQLKIIRSEFLNEIEQFPRALAGFMPRVSAGFDTTDSKVTRKSNVPIGGSVDTISVDNSRYSKTLTLDQPIFNGGSSVAELKAAQSAFRASKGNYYAKEQNIFLDEITNYFLDRESSGFVEGLNNKIKVLKRRSYGIFTSSRIFQRLWLDLQGYHFFAFS